MNDNARTRWAEYGRIRWLDIHWAVDWQIDDTMYGFHCKLCGEFFPLSRSDGPFSRTSPEEELFATEKLMEMIDHVDSHPEEFIGLMQ